MTGRGAIRFRNREEEIVATLPTYRKNGLWFTELAAIPVMTAADTAPSTISNVATIQTVKAPDSDDASYTAMAITDSNCHYPSPPTNKEHSKGTHTIEKPASCKTTIVATVDDDDEDQPNDNLGNDDDYLSPLK